ncbi:MAG: aldo/keto reductase [Thermoplasma sp.]|nr:MAG: aldo/keto reductase [Thermoplasma sp.]
MKIKMEDSLSYRMELREFGKTGEKVSRIGVGTYYDVGWMFLARFGKRSDPEGKVRAIRTAVENGVTLIDTAEVYGSEDLVARAIEGFDRSSLFIATKVWITHMSYDSAIKACRRSLKRLNMKYIDLYQIHFPSPVGNMEGTLRAMEKLVDDGLVRYIGVSNFNLRQLKDALGLMKKYDIVSNQIHYSLKHRIPERDIIPFAEKNGMAILSWYPLEHGDLVRDDAYPSDLLTDLRKRYPGIRASQIALSYLMEANSNVFPIPRASNPDHVIENIESVKYTLSEDEINRLKQIFST